MSSFHIPSFINLIWGFYTISWSRFQNRQMDSRRGKPLFLSCVNTHSRFQGRRTDRRRGKLSFLSRVNTHSKFQDRRTDRRRGKPSFLSRVITHTRFKDRRTDRRMCKLIVPFRINTGRELRNLELWGHILEIRGYKPDIVGIKRLKIYALEILILFKGTFCVANTLNKVKGFKC